MIKKLLDFRSDTVTQPTERMRKAMAEAVVGDDILGEDPTVQRLESMSAELFGKEAGLFVVSGTMANQIAIMSLCQLGDEIIVGESSHIFNLEVGALAALSGVQARPVSAEAGLFTEGTIQKAIRTKGIQAAVTRVLCLENTHDLNRGMALSPEAIKIMAKAAHKKDVAVYLDGARIFNAAQAFGVTPEEMCRPVDCLQFCLTKGLAAPVGSILLGTKEFIERARWLRQRIGGGMRQAGHIAAAGIVALEDMRPRLQEDHDNAAKLCAGLAKMEPGLVEANQAMTNIVRIDFAAVGKKADLVANELSEQGIRIKVIDETVCRMVTHWGIDSADITTALEAIKKSVV